MTSRGRSRSSSSRSHGSEPKALTRGDRNVAWIERHCVIPEGRDVGKPVRLAPFMAEDIRAIYDNPAGTRRAIISRGRKNAKTTESAFIALLHLCGPEARLNGQLFSAAQSRDQAAVLFALAAKIVRLSPTLAPVVTIRDSAKQLFCPELGTLYRALSAEASTAYGLSPCLIIHDELGQVRGPKSDLYEALETATAAQQDPLSIVISTQAPNDADLLSVLIDDAASGRDPKVVLRLDTAPPEFDAFSKEAIRAANPAFDHFMNQHEVLAMAADAHSMPSRQAEYENLVLNRRVEARAPFISRSAWAACSAPPPPLDDGEPVYGGLDLSATSDLTAFILVGRRAGRWGVICRFFLPEEGLAEKSRADRVPYDLWARRGDLLTCPGRSVDYDWVAAELRRATKVYSIRKIAFDRWNMVHFRRSLLAAGFTEDEIEELFVPFGQGFQSMSPALRALEGEVLNARIAHGGHPVLAMCAANATVAADPAGNRKLVKDRRKGRIDGMVALAMALGVAPMEEPAQSSVYEARGLLMV